ncbi:MAG: hypothetical protein JOZ73_00090, partial [Solirubrobacterales bacterium]|nr:hypothetical protein [Solirubrobacterales bacterium]
WQQRGRRQLESAPAALVLPDSLDAGELPRSAASLGFGSDAGEVANPVVNPGERAARDAMTRWLADHLPEYAAHHNDVAEQGTSCLSPHLRWGCLSAAELEHSARQHGGSGADAWIRQLAWRDFYAHVLLNWPDNLRVEFQEKMRALEREQPEQHLPNWRRGETGYPIVDAGMRQLAQTGWMHNRVRLIVASFLTKDLHIDWREGERWFELMLLDGEPAQNNGNWQWIASVGTDPAPPFRRIYNPTLQARSFDPEGLYIRSWVPELANVPPEKLAEPWTMTSSEQRAAGCTIGREYPAPIVDHAVERKRALSLYAAAAT